MSRLRSHEVARICLLPFPAAAVVRRMSGQLARNASSQWESGRSCTNLQLAPPNERSTVRAFYFRARMRFHSNEALASEALASNDWVARSRADRARTFMCAFERSTKSDCGVHDRVKQGKRHSPSSLVSQRPDCGKVRLQADIELPMKPVMIETNKFTSRIRAARLVVTSSFADNAWRARHQA